MTVSALACTCTGADGRHDEHAINAASAPAIGGSWRHFDTWLAARALGASAGHGQALPAQGPLVSPEGETVLLLPALTIERGDAKEGLDIVEAFA